MVGENLTLTGSSSVNDGNYHHICVSKRNSLLSLYIDGQLETSGSDVDREPTKLS
jgi:predicted membrane-bound spermidine synthase